MLWVTRGRVSQYDAITSSLQTASKSSPQSSWFITPESFQESKDIVWIPGDNIRDTEAPFTRSAAKDW
jgi:hypothetical protein